MWNNTWISDPGPEFLGPGFYRPHSKTQPEPFTTDDDGGDDGELDKRMQESAQTV